MEDDLSLEPIISLAYLKPLARHLQENPPDRGRLKYYFKFGEVFPSCPSPFEPSPFSKSAAHRRIPRFLTAANRLALDPEGRRAPTATTAEPRECFASLDRTRQGRFRSLDTPGSVGSNP